MKSAQSGHMLLLVLFPLIFLAVAAVFLGGLWWYRQSGVGEGAGEVVTTGGVEPVASVGSSVNSVCPAVVGYGINPETGVCQEYGRACDVPKGWQMAAYCTAQARSAGWQSYTPSTGAFSMLYPPEWDTFVRQTSIGILDGSFLITQVAFDEKVGGVRNPLGEILGRVELSWLSSSGFVSKGVDDLLASYYKNASPSVEKMKVGGVSVVKVVHSNCSENGGCVDFVFQNGPTFYILRSLRGGTRQMDVEIMATMLDSWQFAK